MNIGILSYEKKANDNEVANDCCITGFSGIALAEKVTYPNIDGIGSESIGYSVLKLALEKSEPDIEVYLDKQEVNQTRAKYMVEIGKADVFDSGFQPELEARFKPIYLPIDRGILLATLHHPSRQR